MDANLNTTQCLKESMNWGETIVRNICNGSIHSVPWGTMDYVVAVLAIAVVGAIIGLFAALLLDIVRN